MAKEKETAVAKEATPYEILHSIDVTPLLVKKQGLDYLPWAVCDEVLNKYFWGEYSVDIIESSAEIPYFTDGRTAWVKVAITIRGFKRECILPVMDNRNKSIPLADITSFDVNDSHQRAKVKCMAYHGLGTDVFTKLDKIFLETADEAEKRRASEAEQYRGMMDTAINEASSVKDLYELTEVWNKYPQLQKDNAFRSVFSNIKNALLMNSASQQK